MDFEKVQYLPHHSGAEIQAVTPTLKFVTINLTDRAVARASEEYSLPPSELADVLAKPLGFARTYWLNEVCHRYTFERSIALFELTEEILRRG